MELGRAFQVNVRKVKWPFGRPSVHWWRRESQAGILGKSLVDLDVALVTSRIRGGPDWIWDRPAGQWKFRKMISSTWTVNMWWVTHKKLAVHLTRDSETLWTCWQEDIEVREPLRLWILIICPHVLFITLKKKKTKGGRTVENLSD